MAKPQTKSKVNNKTEEETNLPPKITDETSEEGSAVDLEDKEIGSEGTQKIEGINGEETEESVLETKESGASTETAASETKSEDVSYIVLVDFKDKLDLSKKYKVGDVYQRQLTDERHNELTTSENVLGEPILKVV